MESTRCSQRKLKIEVAWLQTKCLVANSVVSAIFNIE